MVIGFSVLWLVLLATQAAGGDAPGHRAVADRHSLMDMVTVMVRRLLRRQSPFKAGRDHLHHILMRRGLNARQALAMSTMLAVTLACVGICSEVLKLQESLMLVAFLLCFCGYFAMLREPRQATVLRDNPSVGR